jgi:hypothetical protein
MKKIVRTVWIGLLSGLAIFAASCCSQNKVNKPEQNTEQKPGQQENEKEMLKQQQLGQLHQQLDSINTIIQRRESSCVYGSPEIIQQYGQETRRLKQEAENIINQIKELENE